jgi:glucokinase-like ROK family protein
MGKVKVKQKNEIRRNLILRALLTNGQMSLTELKNETGITLPVVSRIIGGLKKKKLVVNVDSYEQLQAGRPPSVVKINGNSGYIMGIDLDRIYTNFVIINLEQKIILSYDIKKAFLSNNPSILTDLEKEIQIVLKKAGIKWDLLLGIGISVPGIVNGPKGISKTYLNFGEKPLRELLSEQLKKPVHIEHDVKALALGELWFGNAKNKGNVLCLKIDWGLGLGIIMNGKIYYGSDSYSGEFGHLSIVNDNGDLCYCGKRGCLETVASGRVIIKKVKEKLTQGLDSLILDKSEGLDEVDSRHIVEAANKGDQFALEILEEMAQYIGYGTGFLINLFNPECVILGGYIASTAPSIFTDIVRTNAIKKSLSQLNKNVEFIRSNIGVTAGAMGVAMLAARDLFEIEHLNPFAYI